MRSTDSDGVPIANNEAGRRFEARFPEGVAVLQYRYDAGGALVLVHTEVPPALRKQGIASRLAAAALSFARERGLEVVPVCPFVAAYVKRHPELAPLIHTGKIDRRP
jgi:uncharacterized protein